MSDSLTRGIAAAQAELHGMESRAGAEAVAREVRRLNARVRDLARPVLTFHDQPGDFAARLLACADVTNG